jgi:hypothetical protein
MHYFDAEPRLHPLFKKKTHISSAGASCVLCYLDGQAEYSNVAGLHSVSDSQHKKNRPMLVLYHANPTLRLPRFPLVAAAHRPSHTP